jgi:hypothetical protein
MDMFSSLTKEQEGNNFVQYSQYYYSLSALKSGKLSESYFMLVQLTQKYPTWRNISEAWYLFANVAFEQKKYRYGLNALRDKVTGIKDDVENLKSFYLNTANIDTLKLLQKSYSADKTLAKVLAKKLSVSSLNEKDKMLYEYLIQEYKLERTSLAGNVKPITKSTYNVAVMFPFMYKELEAETGGKGNSYVLELYEGIRAAVDSLRENNININLYAYDTGKDLAKLDQLLKLPEMLSMDMFIGPLIPAQNALLNSFAMKNQVHVINPLSNNSKVFEGNEFVYLFQPTLESQVSATVKVATQQMPPAGKNNVIIIYGDTPRDSTMAKIYKDSITAAKYNVVNFTQIEKDKISSIANILRDSLRLTKANHIFVASADQTLAANAITALEKSRVPIPVFTRSEWLNFSLLSFEQLQRRQIYFIYPEYIDYSNPTFQGFEHNFIQKMNVFPSTFASTGYELMNYFGKALSTYGVNFGANIPKAGIVKGELLTNIDYRSSRDNKFVPILKFEENLLKLQNAAQ